MEWTLPSGVVVTTRDELGGVGEQLERGTIVNDTELPDSVVQQAVHSYIEENASVLGINAGRTSFQMYANDTGSFLGRSRFRTPGCVFDEIALARNLAERDDDVGAAMDFMSATAFGDGMQNTDVDEEVIALYNKVAENADLDMMFHEFYREWLIARQFTSVCAFTSESFQFQPEGADRQRTRTVIAPVVGVLPAEQIRIVGNDVFRTGQLAYKPATAAQEMWLAEFFGERTTPARKAQMRRQEPVLTTLLVEELEDQDEDASGYYSSTPDPPSGRKVYRLNPRLAARSAGAKGTWKYPRPLMTRNFALLEAKRLLNFMDYALLQAGTNFLVVAKQGSDARPGMPEELQHLRQQVAHASRAGVLIGDHRLSVEIITPKLEELLSPTKRKLLGRKLAMALMRIPEHMTDNPAAEGMRAELEVIQRVVTADRLVIRRHVQRHIYGEVEKRNANVAGRARILFPKIVLQGTQAFTDYVLKLRDRGDIPRRYAVEAAGFDYDAAVATRRREKANGDDRALTPAPVPFSAPGPQDNGGGRPPGGSPNNGLPGARPGSSSPGRPTRVIAQNAGETVRAMYEDGVGTYRIGELTYAILDEYAQDGEDAKWGRLTAFEHRALERLAEAEDWPGPIIEGPVAVVPVNPDYEIASVRAIQLAPGLRMLVGRRVEDDAVVARAFAFREPHFKPLDGEERAAAWGFPARPLLTDGDS